MGPVADGGPATDDVDGGLLGEFVRREFVEHFVHDEGGFAVALHLEVGHGEAEAKCGVEALDFFEVPEFAADILNEARVGDFRVGVGGGGFGGLELLLESCEAVFLVADEAVELPDALEAGDGFAELALFEESVAELQDECLERDELRDVRHVRVFLLDDLHGGVVVAEFFEGVELENDGAAARLGRQG